ncbi:hypothetical protein BC941DRAFT_505963 [Chlamydoabsidia padenii]|nr:hypothetical protein BC941DRAFT_505963 [Chlamydoabsidia padenii]
MALDPSYFLGHDRSYSTTALTADDAKKKFNGRKGIGKFFKKLGKTMDDDDGDAPQVRSVGHVVSVKSPRTYHNIPLAPPPALPPPTTRQSDDLIGNPPQEYRSTLINNKRSNSASMNNGQDGGSHFTTSRSLHHQDPILRRSVSTNTQQHPQPQKESLNTVNIGSTDAPPTLAPLYHEPLKDHELVDQTSSVATPPRWSASTRKSSASFSIYSTFGGDSFTSQEALDSVTTTSTTSCLDISQSHQEEEADSDYDLAQIVSNNVKRRNQARVVTAEEDKQKMEVKSAMINNVRSTQIDTRNDEDTYGSDDYDDNYDDDYDDDDDNDEIFVDANGYSQEDIEREKIDARLSKRLSGGHFGSAGGLLHSIEAAQRKSSHHFNKPLPQLDLSVAAMIDQGDTEDNDNDDDTPLSKDDKERSRQKSVDALLGGGSRSTFMRNDSKATTLGRDTTSLFNSPLTTSSVWNENPNLVLNGFDTGLLSPSLSTRTNESSRQSDNETQEAKEMADRLWNEDESFVTKAHMAEWLGTRNPLNSQVLVHYMNYFDFQTMRLDSAFRKLCGKLYFKAEAQQIDRILEVFAKRYWKCNHQSVFGSSDVVYAVVYSLLLLNTDLHVAQGNYARMTKQAFVKNTMSTIVDQSSVMTSKTWEINMESYLKDLYISVKQNQILQPMSDRPGESRYTTLEKRSSLMGGRRVLEMKRNMGAIIRKSMHESSTVFEESDNTIYPVKSPSSPLTSSQQQKRDSVSSVGSSSSFLRASSSLITQQSSAPYMDSPRHSISSSSNNNFFVKEGVVMRKHLLENATHKAKHRDWRECLLVVADGELKMYAIQGGHYAAGHHPVNNKLSSDMNRRSLLRSSGIGFTSMAESLTSKTTGSIHEYTATPSPNVNNKHGVSDTSTMILSLSFFKYFLTPPFFFIISLKASTQLIGTISLNHSLANVLPPPGYNRQRPFVFAIQQSHGGVYLFQTGSQSQVNEWTYTCNYWAARQSKEPLPGGVSNMEYGWGDCLHDVILNLDEDDLLRKELPIGVEYPQSPLSPTSQHSIPSFMEAPPDVMIYDWLPPAPPMMSSQLDEKDQYEALQKHLVMLNADINEHREIKKKIMVRFPSKNSQHTKVMSNWESRSKYLLHEIIKYQNYCDALEKSAYLHDGV